MLNMKNKKWIFVMALLSVKAFAAMEDVERVLSQRMSKSLKQRAVVIELVDSGYVYTAIPWMKEYLISTPKTLDTNLEKRFDKMLQVTGVKPFEVLPEKFLNRSRSPSIRYILAKKYLKKKRYSQALEEIKSINANHPIYPFAMNLLGSTYSLMGRQDMAVNAYKDCQNASSSKISSESDAVVVRQLKLNEDVCTAGVARALFADRKYDAANLQYLDISKSSHIWPSILFEEAWNSYYQGNYNRTLGKLVTYKAPVLQYMFNPEIDVLRALSYLKLCLYDDAQKESDEFYQKYMEPTRSMRSFLRSKGKNYDYYYRLYADFERTGRTSSELLSQLLKDVSKDGAFIEIKNSLIEASVELKKLSSRKTRYTTLLTRMLSETIDTQRSILGGYVRKGLISKYAELYHAFEGMSYIKLEVLSQKKQRLYSPERKAGKRGDVRFLERNDKQYFWNFNGEFWADELGDYVFALKSEC